MIPSPIHSEEFLHSRMFFKSRNITSLFHLVQYEIEWKSSFTCTDEGILFKDDRPSKIPRLQGGFYICNKDPALVAATTSLSYLSLGNTNSHSKINRKLPLIQRYLEVEAQYHMVENENKFNCMNVKCE